MSRAEAFDVVRQRGGTLSPAITKRTKLLIVGELGWPLLDDGRPSNKLSRATALSIPIASERRFLEWVGKSASNSDQKSYSADQLAALSKMSMGMIQELASWTSGTAASAFVILRVPGRSPSCSMTVLASRKLSAPSAKSENGCPMPDWPRSGFVSAPTVTSKSNSLTDARTNTVSSS